MTSLCGMNMDAGSSQSTGPITSAEYKERMNQADKTWIREAEAIDSRTNSSMRKADRVCKAGYLVAGAILLATCIQGCAPDPHKKLPAVQRYLQIARQVSDAKTHMNYAKSHLHISTYMNMQRLPNPTISNIVASADAQGRAHIDVLKVKIGEADSLLEAERQNPDVTKYLANKNARAKSGLYFLGAGILVGLSSLIGHSIAGSRVYRRRTEERKEALARCRAEEARIKALGVKD
jgi:hypothetical protein